MPIYEYRCGEGHVFERILPVEQYLSTQHCQCGEVGQKVILHAPRVFGDYEGYESPSTGRWIEGRRAREADLRMSGCRPYELGEREELAKRQVNAELQEEKLIEVAVEQTLQEMVN